MKTPDNDQLPCYKIHQFIKDENNLYADASDLHINPGQEPFDKVWDDSCDVGFWMQTESGSELFLLAEFPRSRTDCDRAIWMFRSYDGETTASIFND